jgi:Protein of unknown function (DUF3570)
MKKLTYLLIIISISVFSQEKDSIAVFKKRVLEATEVDFLSSYYSQDGKHSAVGGGIGSEQLTDFATNIVIAMPLNDDDVLTIDSGISAYSSASSSNINPFYTNKNTSGASGGGSSTTSQQYGTPWQASSGASRSDQLIALSSNYSHSSDNRNLVWNGDISVSNEYDYTSFGFGGGIAKLFNNKNSEFSLKVNAYLDQWRPIYPTELSEYGKYGSNFLSTGYFKGVTILEENNNPLLTYLPNKFTTWDSNGRNSYSASFGFSQVVNKKLQISLFFDLLQQNGQLSTPYQRVYFADKPNFYVGNPNSIAIYESPNNKDVYRLADDIERLPNSRFKIPIGARLNYYINERFVLRTYYRYYADNWSLQAQTASIELPIKLNDKFTVFPMYRYYVQSQSKYFAAFEKHLSTEQFYTSDYDLSTFNANQYGFGAGYTDIFTSAKIWKLGLKNIDFRFNHYTRSDGLVANIGSIYFKFVMQ